MAMFGRVADDDGAGSGRGGSPFTEEHSGAPFTARGGYGAETSGVTSSKLSGNVHSSRGFRRALRASQNRGNRLASQLPQKQSFGGPGYRKPNYFAQGGGRRGLHIGSGAPFTGAAEAAGGADTP